MAPGRILALDIGDRRIGLAITDPLNLTAQPLFTIHRTTPPADLKSIARFIRKHDVTALVVGNPLHADGTASPQSVKTLSFAQTIFAEHPHLSHHLLDERLTTREAHTLLDRRAQRQGAADRIDRKERIDQIAAILLLEAFLTQENGPVLLPDPDHASDRTSSPISPESVSSGAEYAKPRP